MIKIISNKKLDDFFEKALLFNFFVYSFCLVTTYSAMFMTIGLYNMIISIFIKITFLFLPIKIFYDFLSGKFSIKHIIFYGIIGILVFISFIKCKSGMSFLIFLYIVAFNNMNKENFIKCSFFSLLIPIVIYIVSSFFFDTSSFSTLRENNIVRHSLGFWYSAYSANHFLSIVLIYFLYNKNIKNYHYIIINIINILLFVLTNTRFVFILVILSCIFHYIIKNYENKSINLLYYLTMLSYPFGFLFMGILAFIFGQNYEFTNKLNSVLTGRLQHVYNGFFRCHIYLFGSQVEMSIAENNYNHVDPQYFYVLYSDGVIVLILFFVLFFFITFIAYKTKNKYLLLVMLIASLRTCFDPQLMTLHLSPFILLVSPYIYKYVDSFPDLKKCQFL